MKSLDELKKIKEQMEKELAVRTAHDASSAKYKRHVLVCGGTGCTSSNSPRIIERLNAEIEKNGLTDEVEVVKTGCFGLCALGPIMIVYPEGTFYSDRKSVV